VIQKLIELIYTCEAQIIFLTKNPEMKRIRAKKADVEGILCFLQIAKDHLINMRHGWPPRFILCQSIKDTINSNSF